MSSELFTDTAFGQIPIKCVASNIRNRPGDWTRFSLSPGTGREGDLIVVKALADKGSTTYVENHFGRDERIYKDDHFMGVLANRLSGTSESGIIPGGEIDINLSVKLHLLSTGGVIGINTGIPIRMYPYPFELMPLGLVQYNGQNVNIQDFSPPWEDILNPSAPMVVVCGTSAEVGKTTTTASLIIALRERGLKVAGTKFAGTGRMRDIVSFRDAGAYPTLDFPDFGLATTYTSKERFTPATYTLFNHVNQAGPDIIVAEAGGDPIEANVPTFLHDSSLMQHVTTFVVVAGDVMGMLGSVEYLKRFINDKGIILVDPKDRNLFTTRQRVRSELPGYRIFNPLDRAEVYDVVKSIG